MCFFGSKAPKVTPIAAPPVAGPEVDDGSGLRERDRDRARRRAQYGRQSTIIAGAMGGGSPATGSAKTALGA